MDAEMTRDGPENAARVVARLQLGARAGRHRRSRRQNALPPPAPRSDLASVGHNLLLPRFRSTGGVDLACRRVDRWGEPRAPVFQLAFAHSTQSASLLAAAGEDGGVAVLDTRTAVAEAAPSAWDAHRDAVFDVIWTRDDRQLVTAAGDLQLRGWDVETRRALFSLAGHRMSVKCVRQHGDSSTFVSGSRDGHVLLWDTRTPGRPVGVLPRAHAASTASRPVSIQRQSSPGSFLSPAGNARNTRRPSARSRPPPPRSVTCVEFAPDGQELATAGSVDGVVKFWDLRRLAPVSAMDVTVAHTLKPTRQIDCGASGGARRGISTLAFGDNGATLLVGVLNDAFKVVDVSFSSSSGRSSILLECVGQAATSFYAKAAFSPGDDFIVGGSTDGAVYVWDACISGGRTRSRSLFQAEDGRAAERRLPLLALKGHASDVNGVAWSRQDFGRLASGSDDGTVRVWQAEREDPEAEARPPAAPFALRESATVGRGWENWKEFLEQPDGAAYAVSAAHECQKEDEDERKRPEARQEAAPAPASLEASPMVIRRSQELQQRRGGRRRQRDQVPTAEAGGGGEGGRSARRRISAASTAASGPAAISAPASARLQTTLFDCWQR